MATDIVVKELERDQSVGEWFIYTWRGGGVRAAIIKKHSDLNGMRALPCKSTVPQDQYIQCKWSIWCLIHPEK